MKKRKKEKLIVIGLSGKEYEIGFLSPCADGLVIGTAQIGDTAPSHLTVLKKDGKVASHITYQDHSSKRQWFPPMTTNELSARVQALIDQRLIFQLTPEEQSQEVLFLTQKLENFFNSLIAALYQKEVSEKQVFHILNIKNLFEMLPILVQEIKEKPMDYFGRCQAKELLTDKSKVIGLSESGLAILPAENELIGIRVTDLLGANFMGVPTGLQVGSVLNDVYGSLGLPQYFQEEIFGNKFLEKMFSNEQMDKKTLAKFKALTESQSGRQN